MCSFGQKISWGLTDSPIIDVSIHKLFEQRLVRVYTPIEWIDSFVCLFVCLISLGQFTHEMCKKTTEAPGPHGYFTVSPLQIIYKYVRQT